MDVNDDEPEDVKKATSVEKEIKKGEKDDTFEGYPRIEKKRQRWQHCNKSSPKKSKAQKSADGDCCQTKREKAAKSPRHMTVMVFKKPCSFPKRDIVPRDRLSKQEYIKLLSTPSRRCPPDYPGEEVVRRIKPVSPRIKELARPPRHRMLITLEEGAAKLPTELVDNLIKTLEGESCLTPEQTAKVFKDKKRRKQQKPRPEPRKIKRTRKRRKSEVSSVTGFDKNAATCQYLMAERFVKSILEWKCPIPKDEFRDISEVILRRLSYVLEYTPLADEDRKSQQMRYLADIIACWISGVLFEVAEDHKKELQELCEKKRKEQEEDELQEEEEEEEEETDEDIKYTEDEEDEDEEDDEKDRRKPDGRRGRGDDKQEKRDLTAATMPPADKETSERDDEGKVTESMEVIQETTEDETEDESTLTEGQTEAEDVETEERDQEEYLRKQEEERRQKEREEAEREAEERRQREQKEEEEREREARKQEANVTNQEFEVVEKEMIVPDIVITDTEGTERTIRNNPEPFREINTEKQKEEEERKERELEAREQEEIVTNQEFEVVEKEMIIPDIVITDTEGTERTIRNNPEPFKEINTEKQKEEEEKKERELEARKQEEIVTNQEFEVVEKEMIIPDIVITDTDVPEQTIQNNSETVGETNTTEVVEVEVQEEVTQEIISVEIENDRAELTEKTDILEEEIVIQQVEVIGEVQENPIEENRTEIEELISKSIDTISVISEINQLFRTDLPFVTLDKIINTLFSMISALPENTGEDPLTNRIHRAVFEKFSNLVTAENPEILTPYVKDVIDVVCGKIAVWLKTILTESQIAFTERFPPEVESKEVREWSKWLVYIIDTANDWHKWLHRIVGEAEGMQGEKITRGKWHEWTKNVDAAALLWRRFHLQAVHQAHHNVTMMTGRQVVKTGTKRTNFSIPEQVIRTTDLQA